MFPCDCHNLIQCVFAGFKNGGMPRRVSFVRHLRPKRTTLSYWRERGTRFSFKAARARLRSAMRRTIRRRRIGRRRS